MKKVRLAITLRPEMKAYIAEQAKKRQLSFSRYIESMLYKEGYTYSMEELDEDLKQAFKDDAEGKLPTFDNIDDMIKALKS